MNYKIKCNGDLEITGKVGVSEFENIQSDNTLYEVFEPLVANGLSWVSPEDIGALTDAPILSDSALDDSGKVDPEARVWWYPNYALTSPVEDLVKTGKTVFQKA